MSRNRYRTRLPANSFALHPTLKKHVVADREIKITRRGRLRLRLVVAKNKRSFDALSAAVVGQVYRTANGLVNPLRMDVISFKSGTERRWSEFDSRYFAFMLLRSDKCSAEAVAHECGHAALFYARRAKANKWHGRVPTDDDEAGEAICYPLGATFRAVNIALHDAGIWK